MPLPIPAACKMLPQRVALGEPDHILVKDVGRLWPARRQRQRQPGRDRHRNGPRWLAGAHCQPPSDPSLTPRMAAWIGSSRELIPLRALT